MVIFASTSHWKLKYDKSEGLSFRLYGLNNFECFPLLVRNIVPYRFNTLNTICLIRVATASVSTIVDSVTIGI